MVIGERLRALREHRNMSQGDIEKRTGLLRVYVSRVENGHTVPAIETLEKIARALEVPMYQLFYDGEEPPKSNVLALTGDGGWGTSGRDAQTLHRFRALVSSIKGVKEKTLLLRLDFFLPSSSPRLSRIAAASVPRTRDAAHRCAAFWFSLPAVFIPLS